MSPVEGGPCAAPTCHQQLVLVEREPDLHLLAAPVVLNDPVPHGQLDRNVAAVRAMHVVATTGALHSTDKPHNSQLQQQATTPVWQQQPQVECSSVTYQLTASLLQLKGHQRGSQAHLTAVGGSAWPVHS